MTSRLTLLTDKLLAGFARRPLRRILAYLLLVVVVAGAIYSVVEGKGIDYVDGLWWAVVTLTTVGYGDIAPDSIGMRLVAVWVMASGIVSVALVTATIAARMSVAAIQEADATPGIDDDFEALERDLATAVDRVQHLQHRYRLDERGDDRLAAAARAVVREAEGGGVPPRSIAALRDALEELEHTDA